MALVLAGAPINPNNDMLIYFTIQVPMDQGILASNFYQAVFGAVELERDVPEIPIIRPQYYTFRRLIYLQFSRHCIFRVIETNRPIQQRNNNNMIPTLYLYLTNREEVLAEAEVLGGAERETETDPGGNHFTVLQDPYGFVWMIGRNNRVPNLYGDVALRYPIPPDSIVYITLQVGLAYGDEASQFYQQAFGAVVAIREVGRRRDRYANLMTTTYLQFNDHFIFRVVEVDRPLVFEHESSMIPDIYVEYPGELVPGELVTRAVDAGAQLIHDDVRIGARISIIQDPYVYYWKIGSMNLADDFYF